MRDIECGYEDVGGVGAYQHLINRGPIIDVQIGYDPIYDPGDLRDYPIPNSEEQRYNALIDTVADVSAIAAALANHLGLENRDKVSALVAGGRQEIYPCLAQVYAPSLRTTIYGEFLGMPLSDSRNSFHATLVGRFWHTSRWSMKDGPDRRNLPPYLPSDHSSFIFSGCADRITFASSSGVCLYRALQVHYIVSDWSPDAYASSWAS